MVSNILYFHPYVGKWSNLTNIFQMGWNHQPELFRWTILYIEFGGDGFFRITLPPSISDGFKYGPSLVWKLQTTCPNRKVASCGIHQKLRCVASPPHPLGNLKSEITTWWDTRSPIIMVQWKMAVSELVTLYTIFHWTMFMGGKVVSCCFLHTVDASEIPNNHLGWC